MEIEMPSKSASRKRKSGMKKSLRAEMRALHEAHLAKIGNQYLIAGSAKRQQRPHFQSWLSGPEIQIKNLADWIDVVKKYDVRWNADGQVFQCGYDWAGQFSAANHWSAWSHLMGRPGLRAHICITENYAKELISKFGSTHPGNPVYYYLDRDDESA